MLLLITISYFIQFIFGSKKLQSQLGCGLVGFSAIDYLFDKSKIAQLLFWNEERGKDATGIYTPKTGIKKSLKKSSEYITSDFYNEIQQDSVLIGHVRQATYGVNSLNNAHPFQYGNIVLAHNGTLDNPWILCGNLGLSSRDYDVDSMILAASLNKEQNLYCLSKFEGAAALIFTDTNTPDTLYVYRNKERPLYRGIGDEGMYISSIEKSLKSINCKNIIEFKEDYLYIIKNGKVKNQFKIAKKPFPGILPKTNTNNNWRNRNNHYDEWLEELQGENHNNNSFVEQKPIISTPIKTFNLQYTYRGKEVVNRWLKCQATTTRAGGQDISLIRDNWYFCTGVAKLNNDKNLEEVYIIDEKLDRVKVNPFWFYYNEMYNLNDIIYVFVTSSLVYVDGEDKDKPAVNKGDICKIMVHNHDNRRDIRNELTGRSVVVNDTYLRPASKDEIKDYLEKIEKKKNNKTKKINVEKVKEVEEAAIISLDNILKVIESSKIGTENYIMSSAEILMVKEGIEALRDTIKLEFNEIITEASQQEEHVDI